MDMTVAVSQYHRAALPWVWGQFVPKLNGVSAVGLGVLA